MALVNSNQSSLQSIKALIEPENKANLISKQDKKIKASHKLHLIFVSANLHTR